ncbi:carbohydrate ABC transporter permease [Paenibacillus sp. GCM10023248]|uniref:carbohydrate ABC transporter permease n=1 Tax=Bacillales TaxID=1385 RepID=UPI0023787378|nr:MULTISPECIES: sugar ABC transporter permease [Bacillales]MDD9266140.1 sugar ABC transporter permease [Paenibacillus sp. MAHUQ-63]MDR6878317.1 multiple sugar transport system permease protein [Bacillus sp. 3255]
MNRSTAVAVQAAAGTKKRRTFLKRWDAPIAGYLFILPWLLGFFGLTAYPMFLSLYYSFTDYTLMESIHWVGFRNYERIFTADAKFLQSVKITFYYVIASVPLKLAAALGVALLLNKAMRGISAYRTAIYFPSLIGGSIAVSLLWRNIFGVDGIFNEILAKFGIQGIGWITNPSTALWTLILLTVWQFGSSMVIFLAGLKQIPNDLYEASGVDGANKFVQFFKITLPMLSPTLYFNLIMGVINAFQMFTSAYVITNGGPMNSTYVYALYLYERAFSRYQLGYSSALAWIMLVMIVIVAAIIAGTSKYWVFYETDTGGKKSK